MIVCIRADRKKFFEHAFKKTAGEVNDVADTQSTQTESRFIKIIGDTVGNLNLEAI